MKIFQVRSWVRILWLFLFRFLSKPNKENYKINHQYDDLGKFNLLKLTAAIRPNLRRSCACVWSVITNFAFCEPGLLYVWRPRLNILINSRLMKWLIINTYWEHKGRGLSSFWSGHSCFLKVFILSNCGQQQRRQLYILSFKLFFCRLLKFVQCPNKSNISSTWNRWHCQGHVVDQMRFLSFCFHDSS